MIDKSIQGPQYYRQLGRISSAVGKIVKIHQWARQVRDQAHTTHTTQRSRIIEIGFSPELVDSLIEEVLSPEFDASDPDAVTAAVERMYERYHRGQTGPVDS